MMRIHITGPQGCGKTQAAKIIAKALNKEGITVEMGDEGERGIYPGRPAYPATAPETSVIITTEQV